MYVVKEKRSEGRIQICEISIWIFYYLYNEKNDFNWIIAILKNADIGP